MSSWSVRIEQQAPELLEGSALSPTRTNSSIRAMAATGPIPFEENLTELHGVDVAQMSVSAELVLARAAATSKVVAWYRTCATRAICRVYQIRRAFQCHIIASTCPESSRATLSSAIRRGSALTRTASN
jgi:hypothetical protein